MDKYLHAFFELVRAGLWEKEARLLQFGDVDYEEVMHLAEEQSLVGLVTAGLEHVVDVKVPQEDLLQFIGQTIQLEQCNNEMNSFIAELIRRLRNAGIYTLLVKGQGISLCYEKPLWRCSGDVDLFLSDDNYEKAKTFLTPFASAIEPETAFKKHLGLTIDGWLVELHGRLRNGLSSRIDKELDEIQKDTFYGGKVRSILIGKTQVFLLGVENDIVYVFTHILDHFYKGGIGLRQICDWTRLIWTNRNCINILLLEKRIRKMGLMSEWKAFGAFSVKYLGMPAETMPFYSSETKWKSKADKICLFIMEVGNFGQNRDLSYLNRQSFIVRKVISLKQRINDMCHHARIFPLDSFKFFLGIISTGINATTRGADSTTDTY